MPPSPLPLTIAIITNGARSLLDGRGPLVREMVARGHRVLVVAPDHDAASRAAVTQMGAASADCAMSRSGANPLREIGTILRLRRLLRRQRVDLAFGYYIKPVIYGTIAARLAGVPRRFGLVEGLGFAFTEAGGSLRRRLMQRAIGALMLVAGRWLHCLVFLNPDDRAEFVERGLIARERTEVLGGIGVDLEAWPVAPLPGGPGGPEGPEGPGGPVTFILVARLLRDKGIEDYIAAIRLLREGGAQARFLLLGGLDDNPAGITRAEVEAWVAEGLVEWPGHADVRPWLAQAHVFVLPSYREGVPRSTQEAMAMGRAIITTDAPGCRETVEDGVNGFLMPVRDPGALAAAMERFITDPALAAYMGHESRVLAEARFDVHRQNARLLGFLGL